MNENQSIVNFLPYINKYIVAHYLQINIQKTKIINLSILCKEKDILG